MSAQFYTHALWRVKPGREDEFIEAWKALGDVFTRLSQPASQGTLIQSLDDPTLFYSFGPWKAWRTYRQCGPTWRRGRQSPERGGYANRLNQGITG